MQKSSKVLNIIIGVLYALLGIIWLISGISSLGNVQIILGTNILTYVYFFLPLLIVFAIIGISLYRLTKNKNTGLIALLWVVISVIIFVVGIILYKQLTSDGTYFETLFYTLAAYFVAAELTVPGGIIIMILTAIKKKIER
ncbi:hypothetical protein ACEG19_05850 [Blautia stercoris]|uniref:hypothetical protein n=1 Tax=Blautia stercoris TaxID=871664 RepID=UPI00355B7CD1